MISLDDAKKLVQAYVPGVVIEDAFPYKDDVLVRIRHEASDEAHFDPFFIVKSATKTVKEFSVVADGDPVEIAEAFQAHTAGG